MTLKRVSWMIPLTLLMAMVAYVGLSPERRGAAQFALAQVSNPDIFYFAGAPSGNCGSQTLAVDLATVTIYVCKTGAWTASGGGGGSGTVTSVICGAGLSGGTITTSGTCAVIAASGASNYPACSAISGGLPSSGICTFTISSANLLLMSAGTAYNFIPAQGSGLYTKVTALALNYVYSSCTQYTLTSVPTIEAFIGTTDTTLGVSASGFIDQSESTEADFGDFGAALAGTVVGGTPGGANPISTFTNQPIALNKNGSGTWTLGTCAVKGTAQYSIISLN